MNSSDITFSNLTLTGGNNNGWHLLGNPFPCALKWNDDNWTLTGIGGVAKIWDEAAGNYTDINANGIIPATQGFLCRLQIQQIQLRFPRFPELIALQIFTKIKMKYQGNWSW